VLLQASVAGYSYAAGERQTPPASNGTAEIVEFLRHPESIIPVEEMEKEDVKVNLEAFHTVAQRYGTVLNFEKDENPDILFCVGPDTPSAAAVPRTGSRRSRSRSVQDGGHNSLPRSGSHNRRASTADTAEAFHAHPRPPQSRVRRAGNHIAGVLCLPSRH